jgi:hypothetical protein
MTTDGACTPAARIRALGVGLGRLCHLDTRQDQRTKPILDCQGMAHTDVPHSMPVQPGRNPDFESTILIVIRT